MDTPNQQPQQRFNPWFSIWVKPRTTIQRVLNTGLEQYALWFAVAWGVATYLSMSAAKGLGGFISLSPILFLAVILGSVIGFIRLFVGTALFKWTGSWIGGKGNFRQIRTAVGWSMVSGGLLLVFWAIAVVIFGRELFIGSMGDNVGSIVFALSGLKIIGIIFSFWSFIILLVCLSEVQAFSLWKAFANFVLATLVVVLPIVVLVVGLSLLAGESPLFFL